MFQFDMTGTLQRYAETNAQYQREVLEVAALLPGKYRYSQVESAIRASGFSPRIVYIALAENPSYPGLQIFYEALGKGEE